MSPFFQFFIFSPFSQTDFAFCFDKILYLSYTKYIISFSSFSIDVDSFY